MTPAELKTNIERFNAGAKASSEAAGRLQRLAEAEEWSPALRDALTDYIDATNVMIESSAELIEPALRAVGV